ncbi:MAG: transglycosylase domain-containing protein [Anaerolineales bacterium]
MTDFNQDTNQEKDDRLKRILSAADQDDEKLDHNSSEEDADLKESGNENFYNEDKDEIISEDANEIQFNSITLETKFDETNEVNEEFDLPDLTQPAALSDTPVKPILLDNQTQTVPQKDISIDKTAPSQNAYYGRTIQAPLPNIKQSPNNLNHGYPSNNQKYYQHSLKQNPEGTKLRQNYLKTYQVEKPKNPPQLPSAEEGKGINWKFAGGCFLRSFILAIFGLVILGVCGLSILLVQYYRVLKELPNIEDLKQRASHFETTRILDRNGNLLYEIIDPNAGRRTYVTLDKISPYLVAATIATEDKEYYNHPGYNIMAIFRAFFQNASAGETVSGASTITQQLARNLLFSPEERSDRSYQRKVREAILAAELTRRYSKDEILEIYLNENYYGNLSYGVEAAAETYFHTTAAKLSLGQAAFLAGLPQAPSVYDVYTNREQTLNRLSEVLVLMYKVSQEQGCIYVSNSPQRICIDAVSATQARNEILNYAFPSPNIPMNYPHWVNYIRQQLETQFDPQTIYRSGFTVYTTLEPEMQKIAERVVKQQVEKLKGDNVTDGALVAIQPQSGEILAMVGSADFFDNKIDGQVNMAINPRQPGSSIKPITYLAAFEKGWTAATLIWDVPSEFPPSGNPDDPSPPYIPQNYDEKFHGPVTVRTALANSYNVPAVKALQFIGIYDNPDTPAKDGFIEMAKRLGITTLNRPDYGLALTLGGGDVSLLELTGAYAVLANGGKKAPLISITKIIDREGNIVYEAPHDSAPQIIRPEHAYLITSILSDNKARTPMFGADSVLKLPFPAAVKTGTTNDFRDNWTIGYTPQLVVGVWVGNADYSPMNHISGVTGAAPIWSEFMKTVIPQINNGEAQDFPRPAGIIEKVICEISGTEPSQWCPKQTKEIFAADQPPLPKEDDLWQKIWIDTWTGLRASDACGNFREEAFVLNVTDPFAIKWIKKDSDGKAWAEKMGFKKPFQFVPSRACQENDPRVKLEFIQPKDGDNITTPSLDIYAIVNATQNFKSYQLDYGIGGDPQEWETIIEDNHPSDAKDKLVSWDLSEIPNGLITLRLTIFSTQDTQAELKIHINIQVPTPTPTLTPTPEPTETMMPTFTNTPTETTLPSPTMAPSMTPTPSNTP